MQRSSVLIVDDHQAIVEGVKSVLDAHPEFEVIGTCADGRAALAAVESRRPDLVVLDISMPDMNGVEVTKRIRQLGLETAVVIYTIDCDSRSMVDLFGSGISAFVRKEEPLTNLVLALTVVRRGGTYLNREVQAALIRRMERLELARREKNAVDTLSNREREVFLLFAEGHTVKDIAGRLCISSKTVESHKYNIMDKLRVDSIVEMTKLAIRKNLIDI